MMMFLHVWDPGTHAVYFPSYKGFFSWLVTCLLTQSAARDALVLGPPMGAFLHPKESFPLDHCIKQRVAVFLWPMKT